MTQMKILFIYLPTFNLGNAFPINYFIWMISPPKVGSCNSLQIVILRYLLAIKFTISFPLNFSKTKLHDLSLAQLSALGACLVLFSLFYKPKVLETFISPLFSCSFHFHMVIIFEISENNILLWPKIMVLRSIHEKVFQNQFIKSIFLSLSSSK